MKRSVTLIIVFLFILTIGVYSYERNDEYRGKPPVRVSYVQGDVMVQRGFDLGFEDVTVNLPLVDGDRVATEQGRVEIDLGRGNYLRLDYGTKIEIDKRGETLKIKIWQGSLYLDLMNFTREGDIIIDFREGEIVPLDSGLIRVNMYSGTTEVIVREGLAEVITDDGSRYVRRSQKIRVDNGRFISRPVYIYSSSKDEFDNWNDYRNETFRERIENRRRNRYENSYLPEVLSSYEDDFYENGRWVYTGDYGYCWRPLRVVSTWRPYYNGRWTWVYPYGWTWVSYDSWWYTYHYGRWIWDPVYGWVWAPGSMWGPAWVDWFWYGDYIGWAPIDWYGRPVIVINNVWVRNYRRIPLMARSVVVLKKSSLMARNISRVAINTGVLRSASLKRVSLRPIGAQPSAVQSLRKVRVGNKVILKRSYTPVIKASSLKYKGSNVKIVKPASTYRKITTIRESSFSIKGKSGSSGKVIRKSTYSTTGSHYRVIKKKSGSTVETTSSSSTKGSSSSKKVIKKRTFTGSKTVSSSSSSSSSSGKKKIKKKKKEDYYSSYYSGNSYNSSSDPYESGRYSTRTYRKNKYYGGGFYSRYNRKSRYKTYSGDSSSYNNYYSSKGNSYSKNYRSYYSGSKKYYSSSNNSYKPYKYYSNGSSYSSRSSYKKYSYGASNSGSFWSRFKSKAYSSRKSTPSYYNKKSYSSYFSPRSYSSRTNSGFYYSPKSYKTTSRSSSSWTRSRAFSSSSSSSSSSFSSHSSSSSSSSSHSTFKKRD